MTAPGRGHAVLLAVALLVAACGSGDPDAAAPPARDGEQAAGSIPATTTTTTAPPPPGGRLPTAEDPLRVLLAGDSLMADLSLALSSALHEGGHARAHLVAAPSVPRNDVMRDQWRQHLRRFDPEVIVLMIGVWEGMAEDALSTEPLGSPAWERSYRRELLEPYLRLLTRDGAEVVWIGMPPSPDGRRQLEFSSLNRAVRGLAEESRHLTYVPGDAILANPDGSWAEVLPGPQGTPQRVRRVDTTHLCPGGVVLLVRPVLQHLRRQWAVPVPEGWPTAGWDWVFPPEDCPPP